MIINLTKNTLSQQYSINGKPVTLTTYTQKAKAMQKRVASLTAIKRTSFKSGPMSIDEYELV